MILQLVCYSVNGLFYIPGSHIGLAVVQLFTYLWTCAKCWLTGIARSGTLPCWCRCCMLQVLTRLKPCLITTLNLKYTCLQEDLMILKLFCNLNGSMVPWIYIPQTEKGFGAAFSARSHSFPSLPTHAIFHIREGMHSTSCLQPSCCKVNVETTSSLLIHNHRATPCHSPLYALGWIFTLGFRECWHI